MKHLSISKTIQATDKPKIDDWAKYIHNQNLNKGQKTLSQMTEVEIITEFKRRCHEARR